MLIWLVNCFQAQHKNIQSDKMWEEKLARLLAHLKESFNKEKRETEIAYNTFLSKNTLDENQSKELYIALIKVVLRIEIIKFNQTHV